MRSRLAPVLALACLAGCGQPAPAVDATVERFYASLGGDDGTAACELLSESAAREVERSRRRACGRALTDLELTPAAPVRTRLYLTSAWVRLSNGESAFLDETPTGWRISAIGCRPRREAPLQCEVRG